jgi:hypothetical protein
MRHDYLSVELKEFDLSVTSDDDQIQRVVCNRADAERMEI